MLGLQPNFALDIIREDEEKPGSRGNRNGRLHDYNPQKQQKRVLKRVRRERNGSASSYSSIESEWMSVVDCKYFR